MLKTKIERGARANGKKGRKRKARYSPPSSRLSPICPSMCAYVFHLSFFQLCQPDFVFVQRLVKLPASVFLAWLSSGIN